MDNWIISKNPKPSHCDWATRGGFVLASPLWADVLEGLGADTLFAWSAKYETGVLIPVFTKFKLRLAFLGFPLTSDPLDDLPTTATRQLINLIFSKHGVKLIRVSRGNRQSSFGHWQSARPDSWIQDINLWHPRKRLRRDLKYSMRNSSHLKIMPSLVSPERCHQLYLKTIKAHGGKERYPVEYFRRIAKAGRQCSRLVTLSAVSKNGATESFVVMLCHGYWAYYLHGASSAEGKESAVNDLLINELISRAKALDARHFSMMSSPWEQPGLIKFKQKWCSHTGLTTTQDLTYGTIGCLLKHVSSLSTRKDREQARKWACRS